MLAALPDEELEEDELELEDEELELEDDELDELEELLELELLLEVVDELPSQAPTKLHEASPPGTVVVYQFAEYALPW